MLWLCFFGFVVATVASCAAGVLDNIPSALTPRLLLHSLGITVDESVQNVQIQGNEKVACSAYSSEQEGRKLTVTLRK